MEFDGKLASEQIKSWGVVLGFQQVGITHIDLHEDQNHLSNWLARKFHGEMYYMEQHGVKRRSRPDVLVPGTCRVISVRLDYLPPSSKHPAAILSARHLAYISRYACGRDYHKLMRAKLKKLAMWIEQHYQNVQHRCFVDSAPVLEKALAREAGLGWIGKHSNLINPKVGSWFFLGEIYTNLPLALDNPFLTQHCGSCQACIDICPTDAIVAPMQVDARRCISYLTIELKGTIPEQFRKLIGNRVYGCDDCQLICPWNKFAQYSKEDDFRVRHGLDSASLVSLFNWDEPTFLLKTEGMAIRRIGYLRWLRNLAVGLGNAPSTSEVVNALEDRRAHPSELVREHVLWALSQHSQP